MRKRFLPDLQLGRLYNKYAKGLNPFYHSRICSNLKDSENAEVKNEQVKYSSQKRLILNSPLWHAGSYPNWVLIIVSFSNLQETTIIVKVLGRLLPFTSFFPSSPRPWPNITKLVKVLVLEIVWGDGGIMKKGKPSFLNVKMKTCPGL